MMKKSLLGAALALGLSVPALAQDAAFVEQFVSADALFATRDQGEDKGLANTLAAREAYQAIVDAGAKEGDLVRAIEGVARTYYFQGKVLIGKTTEAEKKARKAVFAECWKTAIEPLSPKNFGSANPVYFYFRATCLALEAEVSSVIERVVALPNLLGTFKDGAVMSEELLGYEGGGFARVQGGIYGNIEAKPLGIFKPAEALALVKGAIQSPGYSVTDAPAVSGDFFCENFLRQAMVMSVFEQKAEAKVLAEQTVEDFTLYLSEEGIIPESIRAETKHCVEQVAAFAETL